ncbi:MAG TPA: cupin domain-containing protein, partial [Solirubrobacteraceae bacterium]|nr:cupin domain-containing protein [Solirubrobacteraceae bacterium]
MSGDLNVNRPEWDTELGDAPFRLRAMRIGRRAGARELGATLYEVEPGGAISPYHAHHGNEELLLVLAGTPRLRTPEGVRELEPGSVVAFPRGPAGAHRVSNPAHAAEPARIVILSTMHFPDVGEHLDTGTVLAINGPREGRAFPASSSSR